MEEIRRRQQRDSQSSKGPPHLVGTLGRAACHVIHLRLHTSDTHASIDVCLPLGGSLGGPLATNGQESMIRLASRMVRSPVVFLIQHAPAPVTIVRRKKATKRNSTFAITPRSKRINIINIGQMVQLTPRCFRKKNRSRLRFCLLTLFRYLSRKPLFVCNLIRSFGCNHIKYGRVVFPG